MHLILLCLILIENSLSREREPDTVIKNRKRKNAPVGSKEGINGEHSIEKVDGRKSVIADTDSQVIKKKKKKKKEK